jgi:hypothetical protein
LLKLTVTTPLALVLKMIGHMHRDVRAVGACQHEVVGVVLDVVLSLDDSPNHDAKWPLADTPVGSSGVNVAVPSSVPVTQHSSPLVKMVM